MKNNKESSDFVKLAAVIGGILLTVIIIFVVLAKESIVFLTNIAWAFVVLGIVLGAFQYKAIKKK